MYSGRTFAAIELDLYAGLEDPYEGANPGVYVGVNDNFNEWKLTEDWEDSDLFNYLIRFGFKDAAADNLIPISVNIAGSNIPQLCGDLYDRLSVNLYTSAGNAR